MIRIAAGITVVILAFVGLLYLRYSGDDAPEGGTRVVVAARDIAAGTRISEEMVKVVPVREGEIIGGSYPDAAQVVGMVSQVAIAAGEQVSSSKVGSFENWRASISGGPAPVLGLLGKRALSLNIEPTANGRRVHPGDRVDILAANDGAGTATTLVQNVEVLATTDPSSARPPSPEFRGAVLVAVDADQARVLVEWLEKASELLLARRGSHD